MLEPKRLATLAGFGLAAVLAACSGNLGSGSGLAIPAAPQNPVNGPAGGTGSQSRQRSLDGAVYLTGDMSEIPLPPVDGYAVALALGTPGPSPSPSGSPSLKSPGLGAKRNAASHATRTVARRVALESPPASRGTSNPSPSPSSPNATADSSPAPTASPSASPAGPKTITKTIVFPDDAPAAPTPQPSGNVQTFVVRKAIIRGYIVPGADIALFGLGAVRFTIPNVEEVAGRGFTVALFSAGRKHHTTLVAYDAQPTLASDVVSSNKTDALVLKKGAGYLLLLYGDELPATPGPVPSGYPSPGVNPFVTPLPSGAPGAPAIPSGSDGPGGPSGATPTYVPASFPPQ